MLLVIDVTDEKPPCQRAPTHALGLGCSTDRAPRWPLALVDTKNPSSSRLLRTMRWMHLACGGNTAIEGGHAPTPFVAAVGTYVFDQQNQGVTFNKRANVRQHPAADIRFSHWHHAPNFQV